MAAWLPGYPERVEGVAVRQKRRRVNLLHGAGWTSAEDASIARCLVQCADGQRQEVLVRHDQEVLGWRFSSFYHLLKKVQLA